MKTLFIPLKTEYFEAFANGTKTEEYRKAGKFWNEKTCYPGRQVLLSKGYGKRSRMSGVVTATRLETNPESRPGWLECYGPNAGPAFVITIKLHPR